MNPVMVSLQCFSQRSLLGPRYIYTTYGSAMATVSGHTIATEIF